MNEWTNSDRYLKLLCLLWPIVRGDGVMGVVPPTLARRRWLPLNGNAVTRETWTLGPTLDCLDEGEGLVPGGKRLLFWVCFRRAGEWRRSRKLPVCWGSCGCGLSRLGWRKLSTFSSDKDSERSIITGRLGVVGVGGVSIVEGVLLVLLQDWEGAMLSVGWGWMVTVDEDVVVSMVTREEDCSTTVSSDPLSWSKSLSARLFDTSPKLSCDFRFPALPLWVLHELAPG